MRRAVLAALTLLTPTTALAQARIITEARSRPPALYPEQAVLYIKRTDAVVGDCTSPDPDDGGVPDAGTAPPDDAGTAPDDAGTTPPDDAGMPPDDAGTAPPDGGCTTVPGDAITMVVQPRFSTDEDGARFAMLVATPAPPLYSVESPTLFDDLAMLTAPEIQRVRREIEDPALGERCQGCGEPQAQDGCASPGDDPYWDPPDVPDASFGDGGVDVIPLGDYEVLRLPVTDTAELATWLAQLDYAYTQADLDALAPYLARGDTITAVRVTVEGATDGALRPIGLTWSGAEIRPPLALVRPAPDTVSDLTVYISAEDRYQLPDAAIPFAARVSYGEPSHLTRNDLVVGPDRTIDRDPLAILRADLGELRPVEIVEDIVRVPMRTSCDADIGCCGSCNARRHRVRWDAILVAAAMLLVLRRRRRVSPASPASARPDRASRPPPPT